MKISTLGINYKLYKYDNTDNITIVYSPEVAKELFDFSDKYNKTIDLSKGIQFNIRRYNKEKNMVIRYIINDYVSDIIYDTYKEKELIQYNLEYYIRLNYFNDISVVSDNTRLYRSKNNTISIKLYDNIELTVDGGDNYHITTKYSKCTIMRSYDKDDTLKYLLIIDTSGPKGKILMSMDTTKRIIKYNNEEYDYNNRNDGTLYCILSDKEVSIRDNQINIYDDIDIPLNYYELVHYDDLQMKLMHDNINKITERYVYDIDEKFKELLNKAKEEAK